MTTNYIAVMELAKAALEYHDAQTRPISKSLITLGSVWVSPTSECPNRCGNTQQQHC